MGSGAWKDSRDLEDSQGLRFHNGARVSGRHTQGFKPSASVPMMTSTRYRVILYCDLWYPGYGVYLARPPRDLVLNLIGGTLTKPCELRT